MPARKTAAIFLLALLCAAPSIPALGSRDQSAGQPRKIEATGVVRLVGTSLFPTLVITGEEREWHIDQREQEKLMGLQQQTVTVKAQEHSYELFFANGLSAGQRYVLRKIAIIRAGDD